MIPNAPQEKSQPTIITEATVVANPPLCRVHQKLILSIKDFPTAAPAQFVHLIHADCPSGSQLNEMRSDTIEQGAFGGAADSGMTVRRAFSIAGLRRRGDGAEVDVIYRLVGEGTRWMSQLKSGDPVNLLGPLGNHFTIDEHNKLAVLVAGGVGLPPMIWWAEKLSRSNVETVAFVGAQSRDLFALHLEFDEPPPSSGTEAVFAAREFTQHGVKMVLSTDDGSLGFAGYITGALGNYFARHTPRAADVALYTCGPEVMMKTVAQLCERWEVDCQLCMERSMACGMGTCQSCVVPVRDPSAEDGWRYKLCCTEGPVFDRREVIWE